MTRYLKTSSNPTSYPTFDKMIWPEILDRIRYTYQQELMKSVGSSHYSHKVMIVVSPSFIHSLVLVVFVSCFTGSDTIV
jgi:hypothetical protein